MTIYDFLSILCGGVLLFIIAGVIYLAYLLKHAPLGEEIPGVGFVRKE